MSKLARINRLRDAIEEVETAKRALVANGAAYSIQGSHQVTSASMRDLDRRLAQLTGELLRARGVVKRHNYAGVVLVNT